MALSFSKLTPNPDRVEGNRRIKVRKVTIGAYTTGGLAYTPDNVQLGSVDYVRPLGLARNTEASGAGTNGLTVVPDLTNKKLMAFGAVPLPIVFKDDDNAATAGVAVYVHVDEVLEQGTALAHLEFVSPTNADGTGTLSNGGATYFIQDDDLAATGGVALYIDEDATLGSRLLANTGRDCFVMVGDGEFIKITHNATPGTPGVQVYFDEDAANAYERLLFVSPTNANGAAVTSLTASMRRPGAEVANGTDLSAYSVVCEFVGTGG